MSRVRGSRDWRQLSEAYLPYWSHPSSGVMLLEDGSRLAMAEVQGRPHELCDAGERNAAAGLLNRIWRDIGDDNITICVHLVRDRASDDYRAPRFRNEFSRKLYLAYCEHVLKGRLFTNRWYVSLLVSPRGVPVGTKAFRRRITKQLYQLRQTKDRKLADTSEIEGLWLQLARSLSAYKLKRLGYRYNQTRYCRYVFSQIGEAMTSFLGIRGGVVPITTGRIADDIYTDSDQPIFERPIFRILPPGCDDDSDDAEGVRWGSLFSLNNYMEESGPDLLDAVLSLDMPLVLSQYFSFAAKPDAVAHLVRTGRQMKRMKDAAIKQRKGLKKAASKAQGGEEARGEHNISLVVYGDFYREQLKNAAAARAALVNTGAKLVQETGGNMAAYFGQLPGNWQYCTHPGKIGSESFVNFANFGTFPRGDDDKWGEAMMQIPTTARTAYNFAPHVGNNGMTAVFGMTDSGKTVQLCLWMAMLDQYMVDNNGLIFLSDKDDGCKIFIEAIRGKYLTNSPGDNGGWAPLKGFKEATPYARSCLARLTQTMILDDGLGAIPAIDNGRIDRAVQAILRLPIKDRSFWRMRQFLGWDDPLGAGPRLERWCRGNALGWILDGEEDHIDFSAPAVGFNFGPILEVAAALALRTQYLLDRLIPMIDGRRFVGVFDEAQKTILGSRRWAEQADDFWRSLRKLDGFAILATQTPDKFLNSEAGRAILDQCATMAFFPDPSADRRIYCGNEEEGGLGCTEGEFEAVSTRMIPGSRQYLLKRRGVNAESVVCDGDISALPDWYLHVLSGTANRVRLWNELRDKFPNALEAFEERSKEAVD